MSTLHDDLNISAGLAEFCRFLEETDADSLSRSITDQDILDMLAAFSAMRHRAAALEDELLRLRHDKGLLGARHALVADLDGANVVAFPRRARQLGFDHQPGGAA